MKIIMPLFYFDLKDIDVYSFDDTGISIAPFNKSEIPKTPHFSELDLIHLSRDEAPWAMIYDSSDVEEYKVKVNILLLAFKIFCGKRYPFIKYRLCSESPSFCSTLYDVITYDYSHPRTEKPFNPTDLDCIKEGFLSLIEMDRISIRTHNALYFLYSAWHNTKWMDSFILMMCSLESLFSRDRPGGSMKAISTRVASLLYSKSRCTKGDIVDLYKIRSGLVHGNIMASDAPDVNLKKLNHLDFVAVECFRAIADRKLYNEYSDKQSREKLMSTLNTAT